MGYEYTRDIVRHAADRDRFRQNEDVLYALLTQAFRAVTDKQISWALNIGDEHSEDRTLSVKLDDRKKVLEQPSGPFGLLVNAFAKPVMPSKLDILPSRTGPIRYGDRIDQSERSYNGMVVENLIRINPAFEDLVGRVQERYPNYVLGSCNYNETKPGKVCVDVVFNYKWPSATPRPQSL